MDSPGRFAANMLRQGARTYAMAVLEALAGEQTGLLSAGLPATFADPLEDTRVRLLTLAETLDVDRPELMAQQVAWYKIAFAHRNVGADYLAANLRAMQTVLRRELPAACTAILDQHLDLARQRAATAPAELPSWLEGDGMLMSESRRFLLALLENRKRDAIDIVLEAHAAGSSIADLHDHLLWRVQREVGRMWLMAEIPIADEHFSTRIVASCLDRLAALTPIAPVRGHTVLTFAVGGDQHDLGIRMVAERFEMHGFHVLNLGSDMPAHDLDWLLQDRHVDLIAISATLVLHLGTARAAIDRLHTTLGDRCPPILVGGGPFAVVDDLYRVLGADAAANDAAAAVTRAEELLASR